MSPRLAPAACRRCVVADARAEAGFARRSATREGPGTVPGFPRGRARGGGLCPAERNAGGPGNPPRVPGTTMRYPSVVAAVSDKTQELDERDLLSSLPLRDGPAPRAAGAEARRSSAYRR